MGVANVGMLVLVHESASRLSTPLTSVLGSEVEHALGMLWIKQYGWMLWWLDVCFVARRSLSGLVYHFRMCKRVGCVPTNHEEWFNFVMIILLVPNAEITYWNLAFVSHIFICYRVPDNINLDLNCGMWNVHSRHCVAYCNSDLPDAWVFGQGEAGKILNFLPCVRTQRILFPMFPKKV